MACKREHVKKVLVGLILVASISMGGCAPYVTISDNGAEANVLMKYKDVADISIRIRRDVLFVIFDGLASTDMQKYAEKLRDNYVADGFKAICIKRWGNIDKTREATIEAYAQGWLICVMSYSNSDSAAGRGGRNAFVAWTEQQGLPVIEFRCDDTWGNLFGNHVESNVTGILNIRGHTPFQKGPKITEADLENPDTLYWDIYAPVDHIAILRDNDYWFVHQLVCVINGDDPFDPSFFVEDNPPKEDEETQGEAKPPDSGGSKDKVRRPFTDPPKDTYSDPSEKTLRRGYLRQKELAREKAELKKAKAADATKNAAPTSRPAAGSGFKY